jgi:hypothetical protein
VSNLPRPAGLAARCAFTCAALTFLWPHAVSADELTTAQIGGRVAGVYALAEWHQDSTVRRPPQVEGRFIVLDGTITTILRDRSRADGERTSVYVGRYVLDGLKFAYAYDDVSQFAEGRPGTSASHQALWEGDARFHRDECSGLAAIHVRERAAAVRLHRRRGHVPRERPAAAQVAAHRPPVAGTSADERVAASAGVAAPSMMD